MQSNSSYRIYIMSGTVDVHKLIFMCRLRRISKDYEIFSKRFSINEMMRYFGRMCFPRNGTQFLIVGLGYYHKLCCIILNNLFCVFVFIRVVSHKEVILRKTDLCVFGIWVRISLW